MHTYILSFFLVCSLLEYPSPLKNNFENGANAYNSTNSGDSSKMPAASSPSGKSSPANKPPPPPSSSAHEFEIHENSLKNMSIRDLKSIMTSFGISYVGCVEREDLIHRFETSPSVKVIKA